MASKQNICVSWAKKEKKINRLLKQVHLSAMRHRPDKVFKFGIEIPYNFEDAERLDNENGNTLWRDACALEMKQLLEYKTFKSLGIGAPIPDGYEKIIEDVQDKLLEVI